MEPQKNTLMGVLSYLGPLVIISFIVAKDDPFVKFHIKQGLVLFVIEIALWVLTSFFFMAMYQFWMIYNLINLALIVFTVIGIVNVVQGKEKELPFLGQFAKHFPI